MADTVAEPGVLNDDHHNQNQSNIANTPPNDGSYYGGDQHDDDGDYNNRDDDYRNHNGDNSINNNNNNYNNHHSDDRLQEPEEHNHLDLNKHDDDYYSDSHRENDHDSPRNYQHHQNRHHHNNSNYNSNGVGSDTTETQSRYLMSLNRGKASNFYVNGDKFFPGRKIVHNPKYFKDLPHYLDYLTDKIEPRFGAIRKICTPKHGHRVASLQDIRENCDYVVVGAGRFKPYQYDQITPSEKKKAPPFKYDADPVVHNRRLLQSGKINKIETRSKLIKVWPNGDDLRGPRRVLLSPRINPFNLQNVLGAVNEIMKEDCLGTVEKLYFLNGIKVSDVDQITHNGLYVACRKTERFKNCRYNEAGTKNLSTSPRLERKFLAPLNSRSNNSSQSSPEHSNASTQNSVNGTRRRGPRREEDQVFPARPVKHTRSSEKNRNVDLDKDQGGMFKAKQNNRTTHGAREIQDSRHTRTELPVDQRQAKTVEEERVPNGKKAAPRNGHPPRPVGGSEVKANSKRSPPAADQHHQQRQQQQQQQQRRKDSRDGRQQQDDLERQKSAAKIQAGYRGYKTRQEIKSKKREASPPPPATNTTARVQDDDADYNQFNNNNKAEERQRTPEAATNNQPAPEPERGITQEDTLLGEEERAAAKIQAGFRGFQTRQKLRQHEMERRAQQEEEELKKTIAEVEDRAAAKIQAGYRGYTSRKNTLSSMMSQQHTENDHQSPPPQPPVADDSRPAQKSPGGAREDSYDSLDREIQAATKIQSSYRGYMARKEYARKREAAVNFVANDDNNYAGHDHYHVDDGSYRRGSNDGYTSHDNAQINSSTPPPPPQPVINHDYRDRDIYQENRHRSPEAPHRSLSPPLVSNEEAVDTYRALRSPNTSSRNEDRIDSTQEITDSAQNRTGAAQDRRSPAYTPTQASESEQTTEDLERKNRQQESRNHGLPEQNPNTAPENGNTPPQSTQLGQKRGSTPHEDHVLPAPDQIEAGSAGGSDTGNPLVGGGEVRGDEPEDHGKQNGHALHLDGSRQAEAN